MTDLTKQLKKGELLPDDLYWVKHDGIINILDNLEISLTDVEQVLAPVPSYEQWQEYKDANDSMFYTIKMLNKDNYKLEKENAQLKELLKECRNKWVCYKPYDRDQLLKRIDEALKC